MTVLFMEYVNEVLGQPQYFVYAWAISALRRASNIMYQPLLAPPRPPMTRWQLLMGPNE